MTWEDITIGQFDRIHTILNAPDQPLDKYIRVLSVLDKKPEEEILNMPMEKFNEELKRLGFLAEKIEPRYPSGAVYTVNGKKYELTPHARKMSAGQYIDYVNTLREDSKNFGLLCAILLVPKGCKYGEGYDPLDLAAEFDTYFKMVDAMGISFFFLKAYRIYTGITLTYSMKKLEKEMNKNRDPEKVKMLKKTIRQMQEAQQAIQNYGYGI